MTSDADAADFTVFVSYAHSDNESDDPSRRWLNRLLEHLQPLVLQNKVRAWSDEELEAGEQWESSIRAELQGAGAAVLLVSPAFLASKYIRNSELPALLMSAVNQGGTVLPVILRPCLFAETSFKYPDPLRGPGELSLSVFQAANPPDRPLNAMEEHEQDEVLVSVAKRILRLAEKYAVNPPAGAAAAGAAGAAGGAAKVWHVPLPRNPFFTGRDSVLGEISAALGADRKAALSGMGGVGKTQTAVEYAHRHRGEYHAVLWARADTEDALKSDFAGIAARLGLPEKDETDRERAVSAVRRWLDSRPGWLLILDNADDLSLVADLLRREWGGHLLLTTRAHATGSVRRVEIKEMSPGEGSLFLLRRAKLIAADDAHGAAAEADRRSAAGIVREVGGLPLALDQAGAFVEEVPSSLDEYLELYRREGRELRARRGGLVSDHDPVTITFSLAFRQVELASAAAADMLRACTFLAPDAIPEDIFVRGAPELGENLAPLAGGGVNLVKVFGEAARFSLIRRDTRAGTIEIHRLVQQVLRDELGEEAGRLWAERAVRALSKSFPWVEHKVWPLCEKFLPHAQEAARLIEEYGFEFKEAARLLNQAGYYCVARARYAEADSLLAQALGILEKALGPDHPSVATALNNLASLYQRQGKYAEAEPLFVRSLGIREKVLEPGHPDVAQSFNNLAFLYYRQGRYAEAAPLYEQAIGILEKALGPEHPTVAMALSNLGLLCGERGIYAEADPLLARALGILEKALGPDHPDVAMTLSNLATSYTEQNKTAEAEPLLTRALGIIEKALGPEHPDVGTTVNNLALVYEDQGRYEEAESLFARALNIAERALGPEHPSVAMALNNLATLYKRQGKYEEAEPLLARALDIAERALGPDHPSVAMALNNLGNFYYEQGRFEEAESLLARALGISEKALGPEHPNTSVIQDNYTALVKKKAAPKLKNKTNGNPPA